MSPYAGSLPVLHGGCFYGVEVEWWEGDEVVSPPTIYALRTFSTWTTQNLELTTGWTAPFCRSGEGGGSCTPSHSKGLQSAGVGSHVLAWEGARLSSLTRLDPGRAARLGSVCMHPPCPPAFPSRMTPSSVAQSRGWDTNCLESKHTLWVRWWSGALHGGKQKGGSPWGGLSGRVAPTPSVLHR